MPIYEYTCDSCGHEFELLIRGSQRPECPECGKARLTKKFSVPAAHSSDSTDACSLRGPGACGLPCCQDGQCGLS